MTMRIPERYSGGPELIPVTSNGVPKDARCRECLCYSDSMPASGEYRKMEAKQMRLFKWSVILLAFLLAAMAMVPMVSAAE